MKHTPNLLTTLIAACALSSGAATAQNLVNEPYRLDTGLKSRSISFENPTGQPGQGGKAESNLGVGRNPLIPASGPVTGSFNGLHPKSNFLAIILVLEST